MAPTASAVLPGANFCTRLRACCRMTWSCCASTSDVGAPAAPTAPIGWVLMEPASGRYPVHRPGPLVFASGSGRSALLASAVAKQGGCLPPACCVSARVVFKLSSARVISPPPLTTESPTTHYCTVHLSTFRSVISPSSSIKRRRVDLPALVLEDARHAGGAHPSKPASGSAAPESSGCGYGCG